MVQILLLQMEQGALKLATETSGIVVTIGHTTSETTVADNLTITGTTTGTTFDTNGTADAIILDANGNTTISSPTDDQIDFEIAGADDFTMTANTFTIFIWINYSYCCRWSDNKCRHNGTRYYKYW